jgi:hypothetical protein
MQGTAKRVSGIVPCSLLTKKSREFTW